MNNLGLYLHVPFCLGKCSYCDFYSLCAGTEQYDRYLTALQKKLFFFGERFSRSADTVYLGGGTPSLLGGDRIAALLDTANKAFPFTSDAEITLEANPADRLEETLKAAARAGVNRLSLGVQTANENELKMLGRRHTVTDVKRTVGAAREAGIDNVSLDLMIGIPGQTKESLLESIEFLSSFDPKHISMYMLQLEEGTPIFAARDKLPIPDGDATAELYSLAVSAVKDKGFLQYEVSNFSKQGYFSRHNKKYWCLEEYLGIGPSAHSFMEGKRFHFEPDLEGFINGADSIEDGVGGTAEEYIMLSLRLSSGLDLQVLKNRYYVNLNDSLLSFLSRAERDGYITKEGDRVILTTKGFLVQNLLLTEIFSQIKI